MSIRPSGCLLMVGGMQRELSKLQSISLLNRRKCRYVELTAGRLQSKGQANRDSMSREVLCPDEGCDRSTWHSRRGRKGWSQALWQPRLAHQAASAMKRANHKESAMMQTNNKVSTTDWTTLDVKVAWCCYVRMVKRRRLPYLGLFSACLMLTHLDHH